MNEKINMNIPIKANTSALSNETPSCLIVILTQLEKFMGLTPLLFKWSNVFSANIELKGEAITVDIKNPT